MLGLPLLFIEQWSVWSTALPVVVDCSLQASACGNDAVLLKSAQVLENWRIW